jgi:hypothetical protein
MNSLGNSNGTNFPFAKRMIVASPNLTQAVLDQGVILTYLRWTVSGNLPTLLPTNYYAGSTFEIGFRPALNKIVYYFWTPSNPYVAVGAGSLGSGAQFRYILIPGGVSGRGTEKAVEINGQAYTETELRNMSYTQICSLLHIPQ